MEHISTEGETMKMIQVKVELDYETIILSLYATVIQARKNESRKANQVSDHLTVNRILQ